MKTKILLALTVVTLFSAIAQERPIFRQDLWWLENGRTLRAKDSTWSIFGPSSGTSGFLIRNGTPPQSGTLSPATNTDTSFVNYLKSTGYISFTSAIGTAADVWFSRANPGRMILRTTATDSAGVLSLGRIHGYGKSVFDSLQILGQIFVAAGSASAPSYSFTGDGDTGFYKEAADGIGVGLGGTRKWIYYENYFYSAGGVTLVGSTQSSATVPVILPDENDLNTGVGWAGAGILSLIANGINGLNVNNGNVGFGTTTPLTKADITGTLRSTDTLRVGNWTTGSWIKPGDAAWTVVSDVNKKENIRDYAGLDLSKFSQVKPKVFRFKENSFYRDFDESSLSDTLTTVEKSEKRATFLADNRTEAARLNAIDHLGFIAQDFNKLFPGRSKLTIDYAEVIGVQWLKIAELEARIKAGGL